MKPAAIQISYQDTVLGEFWTAVIEDLFDVLDNGQVIGQGIGASQEEAIESLSENVIHFYPEISFFEHRK